MTRPIREFDRQMRSCIAGPSDGSRALDLESEHSEYAIESEGVVLAEDLQDSCVPTPRWGSEAEGDRVLVTRLEHLGELGHRLRILGPVREAGIGMSRGCDEKQAKHQFEIFHPIVPFASFNCMKWSMRTPSQSAHAGL